MKKAAVPKGGGFSDFVVARVAGLEPVTSGVTGRRSNQLSYTRVTSEGRLFTDRPGACQALQCDSIFAAPSMPRAG